MNAAAAPNPGAAAPAASNAGAAAPAASAPADAKPLAITVSKKAVEAIRKHMLKRNTPDAALRLGIRGGGCSGFSYVIEFHDGPPSSRDRVFDYTAEDGSPVRVVVDPKSLLYLNGTELDWEVSLMNQGFKFKNPNEKTSCGCGTSFTV
jgi:iron-sulfur cluster assembly protein